MARRCVYLVLLTLPIGCSDLGPGDIVTGTWGGEAIGLEAERSEARLDFPCLRAAVDGPLVLDSARIFRDTARVTWRSFGGGNPDSRVVLQGEVQGNLMTLTLWHIAEDYESDPKDYTLYRGADPDFSGFVCLAR